MPSGLSPCLPLSTRTPVGLCLADCGEFLFTVDPALAAGSGRGVGAGGREQGFASFRQGWGSEF